MRARGITTAFLTVTTLGGALTGCAVDGSAVAPPDAASPTRATVSRDALTARPISGECTSAFVPPQLPPPPVFQQVDRGTCQLSHLGRTTVFSLQEISLLAGTQTSIEYTYTATNGDILRVRNAGTNVPNGPGVRFSATTTFVGGTGRFAHATGQAHIEGSASFITNTATWTLDGWIAY